MEKEFNYHFRRYFPSKNHPCLVVVSKQSMDKKGNVLLSGFTLTRSVIPVIKRPNKFIKISNPNPHDDADCFLYVDPIKNKSISLFSAPINEWELSNEDILAIEKLVEQKKLR